MQIIPTIEILGNRCVTLRKGDFDDPILWHVDPIETIQGFVAAGATQVRVTDFDAMVGEQAADALIEEVIRKAGVPVQVAGGMRSRERAEFWIEKGAGQVVIGTLAAQAPEDVMTLAKYYPDQVVLSLDVAGGTLRTHGWTSESLLAPEAFLDSFAQTPLAGVVICDIEAEVGEVDQKLGVISALAGRTRHQVLASGVVDSLDDLSRLKYVPNISGAIVGRALMRKTFALEEAIDVLRPEHEEVAAFQ